MDKFEFRLAADGVAHVVLKGNASAVCGKLTKRPAPAKGRACAHCLEIAAEQVA